MRLIVKFFKHSARVRKLVIASFFLSAHYNRLIFNKQFKDIAQILGEKDKEDLTFDERNLEIMCDIRTAINMVCQHTPWESKCLVQAYTAKHLLKKRGIPATVYLGVRKDNEKGMKAHAWTRCGCYYVTGKKGSRQYTVTSYFS